MTHKELEAELASLAGELGLWCWIAQHRSVREKGGMVDAIVLGIRGALFIELKTEDGRRTRAQADVARMLTRLGLAYRLYRPAHFDDGAVRQDLENIAWSLIARPGSN